MILTHMWKVHKAGPDISKHLIKEQDNTFGIVCIDQAPVLVTRHRVYTFFEISLMTYLLGHELHLSDII